MGNLINLQKYRDERKERSFLDILIKVANKVIIEEHLGDPVDIDEISGDIRKNHFM